MGQALDIVLIEYGHSLLIYLPIGDSRLSSDRPHPLTIDVKVRVISVGGVSVKGKCIGSLPEEC